MGIRAVQRLYHRFAWQVHLFQVYGIESRRGHNCHHSSTMNSSMKTLHVRYLSQNARQGKRFQAANQPLVRREEDRAQRLS